MSKDALVQWKSQIFKYQQHFRETQQPQQTALFDLTPVHCDPDRIDPLQLEVRSLSFWRMPTDSPGDACLYFIIDSAADLILYVGETCRSNRRWKGIHACKDYIASYQDLHCRYEMKIAVNITFWWDAPVERRARQALELGLIQKWKSPFNKENWERWGQPFK
ncbi:MAG: GIY-YIG nuclease family protein [Nostoc sp. LLA-1]|nr:GIY-YIG nuclease family protein [Cyanocohniella sp. LLY]